MSKYLRKFETTSAYEEVRQNLVLPNVSLCVQENEVHYNPYVILPQPNNIITYAASAKLTETTSTASRVSGLHINKFNTTIKSHTFENGVGTIEFNDDVTTIGERAFYGCSGMTSIDIPNSITSIGDDAFYSCTGLTSITIPSGVTSIGSETFMYCRGFTSIDIPSGVTSIGNYAFNACTGLTSVTIGSGVTSIGNNAFQGCSYLTSVTIGSGVTSIGKSAFWDCSGLTSITCNAMTAPTIQGNPFYGVSNGGTLYVPIGSSGYETWMNDQGWTKVEQ